MSLGIGVVLVVAVAVVLLLLGVVLRPRRRRLVNRGRRPLSFRMRRMDRIKRAAAIDIALMQNKEPPADR
jgi:hypothetical protein